MKICFDRDDKGRGFNLGRTYQMFIYFQESLTSAICKFQFECVIIKYNVCEHLRTLLFHLLFMN